MPEISRENLACACGPFYDVLMCYMGLFSHVLNANSKGAVPKHTRIKNMRTVAHLALHSKPLLTLTVYVSHTANFCDRKVDWSWPANLTPWSMRSTSPASGVLFPWRRRTPQVTMSPAIQRGDQLWPVCCLSLQTFLFPNISTVD